MYYKKELGILGENYAYNYLLNNGFTIICRNYSCKIGEIDIIGLDKNTKGTELVFVEVKTRNNDACGNPAESVTKRKKHHIVKVAEYFLMLNHIKSSNCRFDVIEVFPEYNGKFHLNHIKNAFDCSDL